MGFFFLPTSWMHDARECTGIAARARLARRGPCPHARSDTRRKFTFRQLSFDSLRPIRLFLLVTTLDKSVHMSRIGACLTATVVGQLSEPGCISVFSFRMNLPNFRPVVQGSSDSNIKRTIGIVALARTYTTVYFGKHAVNRLFFSLGNICLK